MTIPSRARQGRSARPGMLALLILVSALLAWATTHAADAPPSINAQRLSFARATFGVRLEAALSRLEHDIPLRLGKPKKRSLPPGLDLQLEGEREPLRTTLHHDTMFVQTTCKYWLTARSRELGELRCGSPADPRRAAITCMAVIGWGDDWELDTVVTTFPVTHDRNCKPEGEEKGEHRDGARYERKGEEGERSPEIKILALVNARIESTLVQPLAAELGTALREHMRLRGRATGVWEGLRTPFEIGKTGYWLDYDVQRLLARPLVFSGDSLRVDLAAEMLPVLYTALPEPSTRPLPEPRVRVYGDAFEIAFDCGVWLDSLASRARDVCATQFPALGVRRVSVEGAGDQVSVELEGREGAVLRLVGRMVYDEESHRIQVTDLQYAKDSARAGARVDRKALRLAIENALRADISEQIAAAVGAIGYAMNRPVNGELQMSGGVNQRRLLGIVIEDHALVAHWVAVGRAWLQVQ